MFVMLIWTEFKSLLFFEYNKDYNRFTTIGYAAGPKLGKRLLAAIYRKRVDSENGICTVLIYCISTSTAQFV